MKRESNKYANTFKLATLSLGLLASVSSQAALLSRAGGSMYYDTELKITWLTDANYAYTSGYIAEGVDSASGKMDWNAAVQWADQLVYERYSN